MNKFIKDKNTFLRIKSIFEKIFKSDVSFIENPFVAKYNYILSCEFEFLHSKSFFNGLQKYLNKYEFDNFYYYTIDPKPDDYFFKNYAVYSLKEFKQENSNSDFNDFLMTDFGDSIIYCLNTIAFFSENLNWACIGSVQLELGIFGFSTKNEMKIFLDSFGNSSDMFSSLDNQIRSLDELIGFSDNQKKDYTQLIKNYIF